MKVAIMQPYLFPYIGYFSLIKNTDHFVFFDTPQYIRKGWINRNRLLSCNGQDVYFTVPVEKCSRETIIKNVKISNGNNWKEKWLGQLSVYKKKAPYYYNVVDIINETMDNKTEYISDLAINSIIKTCEYLDLNIKYDVFSQMDLGDIQAQEPDEWALYITQKMGYDTYVNPPGGKSFFDRKKYMDADIKLEFLTQKLDQYNQKSKEFIPGLSIIDLMMFCEPIAIRQMMNDYILTK